MLNFFLQSLYYLNNGKRNLAKHFIISESLSFPISEIGQRSIILLDVSAPYMLTVHFRNKSGVNRKK